jgi:hypothetical protein
LLRDSITDTAENEVEVRINSGSNFLNEGVLSAHLRLGLVHSLLLGLVIRMTGVERFFFRFSSLVFLEVHVISENVILLCFDDRANHFESVGPAFSKNTDNDLHNFRL